MKVNISEVSKEIFAGGDVPKDRFSEVKTDEYTVPIYANAEKDAGLYGYTDKARVFDEAVTVAARGTIGYCAKRYEPFLPVVRLVTVIPDKEKITTDYLYYALRKVKPSGSGTSIPQLTVPDIKKYSFNLVELDKQQQIVEQLTKIEGVIDCRKRELEQLDLLIKARFVEMFGEPMDETKANATFTKVVEFNPKKSEVSDMQDTEVSFVPMDHVGVDGSFKEQRTGLISEFYKGYTYFRDGDVLIAKITPCFENGKSAIAHDCCNGIGFGTTEFHVARPIEGKSTAEWVMYLLKNDNLHEYASSKMTGSAGQKRIQTPFFEKMKVYLPSIEEQKVFSDFVKQVDKSKVAVQKALDETQLLFDCFMQQYFV